MGEGRTTESDTYVELVAAGVNYAESWLAQMREALNG